MFPTENEWLEGTYFDHFAYGSNMSTSRLRARCPSAVAIATGYAVGRQLRLHKVGKDGTAKADAHWTDNVRDRLYGVVFRCLLAERPTLDVCESLGFGYEAVGVDVFVEGETGPRRLFLYEACANQIQQGLPTASWYAAHVVSGAAEHCLPVHYQKRLAELIAQHEQVG